MSLFEDKAPGAKPRDREGKARQRLEQLRTRLGYPAWPEDGVPVEHRFTVMDVAEHWKRSGPAAGADTHYELQGNETA